MSLVRIDYAYLAIRTLDDRPAYEIRVFASGNDAERYIQIKKERDGEGGWQVEEKEVFALDEEEK